MYSFKIWIVGFLNRKGPRLLLILDNAGMLSSKRIKIIDNLRDLTLGKLGIVLSAPNYFIKNLNTWSINQKDNVHNFYVKINRIVKLRVITKKEIKYICKAHKITSNQIIIEENFMSIKNIGDLLNSIENYNLSKKDEDIVSKLNTRFY